MIKNFLAALFLLFLPLITFAEEVVSGDYLSLSVDQNTGRFLPYIYTNGLKRPLLTLTDPISSYLLIEFNNKIYDPGNNRSIFTVTVNRKSSTSIEIIKESDFLRIIENLTVYTTQIEQKEYIHYSIQLTNKTRNPAALKARILMDNFLNEETTPFTTSDGTGIHSEKSMNKRDLPEYIYSGETGSDTLYFYFPEKNTLKPDQLWIANWKRINDSNFDTEIVEDRTMTFFPNPEIDSAVAFYYNWNGTLPGGTRIIELYLGSESDIDFTNSLIKDQDFETPEDFQIYTIQSHIKSIDSILSDIDQIMKNGHPLLDEELLEFYDNLEAIRKKKAEYEELQQRQPQ